MCKRLAVVERNGLCAAGVFTPGGLYSCSLPSESLERAVRSAGGEGLRREDLPDDLVVVNYILDIYEGIDVPELPRVRLDFSGLSGKTQAVLTSLMKVPRGMTVTYGQLASMAGLPRASRFVGNVMARNRYAPIVPCHRVVSASGIGGYGLGIELKRALLRKEGALAD
ncbi:MAG: MGMT family protein [Candidatus Thorarchaeota archaeon]|nr:MGMT family protein [Candidatus Thorarchaeota archaeon]